MRILTCQYVAYSFLRLGALRYGARMEKSPLERVARALCSADGHPENIQFEGKPMWESYLPNARVAIEALRQPDTAMISAAATKAEQIGKGDFGGIYQAMINAALNG